MFSFGAVFHNSSLICTIQKLCLWQDWRFQGLYADSCFDVTLTYRCSTSVNSADYQNRCIYTGRVWHFDCHDRIKFYLFHQINISLCHPYTLLQGYARFFTECGYSALTLPTKSQLWISNGLYLLLPFPWPVAIYRNVCKSDEKKLLRNHHHAVDIPHEYKQETEPKHIHSIYLLSICMTCVKQQVHC